MKHNKWERIIFLFTSIIVGIAGIFFNNVIAAIIAVYCSSRVFLSITNEQYGHDDKYSVVGNDISNDRIILTISFLIYSILLSVFTFYFTFTNSFYALSLFCWIISIVLLIISGIIYDQIKVFGLIKQISNSIKHIKKEKIIEIFVLGGIVLIAFILRVIYLKSLPVGVHGDEGEMGMESLRVLGYGEPLAPFRVGWGPLPNLFYYFQAVSIGIFGRNEIGLRMISVIFGTACVLLTYLIGRLGWGKIAGITAAWLMAISHFHIQYSRLGLSNIQSVFFMLLFIYLILLFAKKTSSGIISERSSSKNKILKFRNYSILVFIGITISLAQYMYHASRLILILLIPILFFVYFKKKITILEMGLIVITAIIVISPLGLHYIQNPTDLVGRMDTVSIFNQDNIRNNYGDDINLAEGFMKIFITQIRKNLEFFLQTGDISSFYYGRLPGFDFITALLFWLGLGVIFSNCKQIPEFIIISWFFFGLFFGGVITNNPPYGARLVTVTSTVYIIGGAFTQQFWIMIKNNYEKIPKKRIALGTITAPAFFLFAIFAFAVNYNYYFVLYPTSNNNLLPLNIAYEVIEEEITNHIYLFGEGNIYDNHGTIRFIAGENKISDLKNLEDLPTLINDEKGIVILASPAKFEDFETITDLYPQGNMYIISVNGQTIIKKYKIPSSNY